MARLQSRLVERGISLSFDEAAQNWLAAQGYDPQFGARPLQRVIQNKVQNPLAEALLDGRFQDGDVIAVGLDQATDRLTFNAGAPLADAG
jgi:ATP-dependent Clp protease ATP-binding subunit ClpB